MIKKFLDEYFTARHNIFKFFDYAEDWQDYPIDDMTDKFWFVNNNEIVFSINKSIENPFTEDTILSGEGICSAEIRKPPIIKGNYTLVVGDTNTDSNVYIMIFDNSKEFKDKDLIDLYSQYW